MVEVVPGDGLRAVQAVMETATQAMVTLPPPDRWAGWVCYLLEALQATKKVAEAKRKKGYQDVDVEDIDLIAPDWVRKGERVMQRMGWRNGCLRPRTGRQFLARIIEACLAGLTPEEFADQEMARMEGADDRYGQNQKGGESHPPQDSRATPV